MAANPSLRIYSIVKNVNVVPFWKKTVHTVDGSNKTAKEHDWVKCNRPTGLAIVFRTTTLLYPFCKLRQLVLITMSASKKDGVKKHLSDNGFYDGSIIPHSELEHQVVYEPIVQVGEETGGRIYTQLKIKGTPPAFFDMNEVDKYFKDINGQRAGVCFSDGGPYFKDVFVAVWVLGFADIRDYKQKNKDIIEGADPKTVFGPTTQVKIELVAFTSDEK